MPWIRRKACLGLALLALCCVPLPLAAFEMDVVETDDMRMLYFDPFQTYLVPYAAQNFHNALEYHQKMLGWVPWERPTVILKDFSDYANAGATGSPVTTRETNCARLIGAR